ncbi:hypothetical protein CV016_16280 [Yersinia kristensenii]|uniref:Uncharacterized protein n=1 Tax=Yersinia kristensenii TaxID=28152 RepID=A0AB73Q0R4_YERKR|nr:hypothetical protein CBW52_15115 [Yersinia kristensenii]PHZ35501.1 hypothetical protein CS536_13145 [Yersinia kristensenii]PJG61691.1 hypothetical protein CV016_16280 [Yersinia kristensenii]
MFVRRIYPSYFKLQVCWLRSLTRITYLSKLIGILLLAAFLHLEIYWVCRLINLITPASTVTLAPRAVYRIVNNLKSRIA